MEVQEDVSVSSAKSVIPLSNNFTGQISLFQENATYFYTCLSFLYDQKQKDILHNA